MIFIENLFGQISCEDDSATCTLNGESSRGDMGVFGTGWQVLTLRAITFKDGEFTWGGGIYVGENAKVDFALCSFVYNRATSTSTGYGGGAIYIHKGTVNIIGTWFAGNTAASNNGDDVMKNDGTVSLQSGCPSPFSANVPIKGEIRVRIYSFIFTTNSLYHCARSSIYSLRVHFGHFWWCSWLLPLFLQVQLLYMCFWFLEPHQWTPNFRLQTVQSRKVLLQGLRFLY